MTAFQGAYTALITPMTSDHGLNEEALRAITEFNIRAGIDGFWAAGGSGESVLLDDVENSRIAEIVVDQTKGRAKVIMHVGAPTTKRSARMAEAAAKAGVDAICCIPPFFYRYDGAEVAEHYRVVAAAAGLPFFTYNLPIFTGCEITPAMMATIQERVPQLAGVKHSSTNFGHVRGFVAMGLSCFTGFSSLMLPALSVGAAGCIDGWPGIAPEHWVELRRAFREGDMPRALAAQDKVNAVADLVAIGGFHAVLKAAIGYRLGLDCGTPRPPGRPLSAKQDEALRRRLAELDLLPAAPVAAAT